LALAAALFTAAIEREVVLASCAVVVSTLDHGAGSCRDGLCARRRTVHVAPWLTFRSLLRTRWAVWLGLALLVGVTAGGVMAGVAGARRTASAHDRFLDRQRAADVLAILYCDPQPGTEEETPSAPPDTSCVDDVARLPSVADMTIVESFDAFIATADGQSVQPDENDPCYSDRGSVGVVGDRSGHLGDEINEIRIVAGRRANSTAADEVVLSKTTADRLGLAPGSTLLVSLFDGADCGDHPSEWRPPIPVRVVGIGLAPGEVAPPSGLYFANLHVTPAFVAAHPPRADFLAVAVRLRAGADAQALLADISSVGGRGDVIFDLDDYREAVARGIRPQAIALAVVAALVAVAGACILSQTLVRQSEADAADWPKLTALGMSRSGLLVSATVAAGFLAVVAGVMAGVTAISASLLTPIGLAGEIEPDPGLSVDAVVVAVGMLSTALFVMVIIAVAGWRRSARRPAGKIAKRRRPAAVAAGIAKAGFPPTVVSGVHLALNRGREGGAVPVGTRVAAVVVAIFTIVGALTFGAGLTHLLETPRLRGVNWDILLAYPTADGPGDNVPIERTRLEAALADHPGVESFAAGTLWPPFPPDRQLQLGPERRPVALLSFDGTGGVGPSLIRGRAPTAPDEVLVGPETLDDLGLALGDTVDVYGQAGTWDDPGEETSMRARIVGVGVIPLTGAEGLGRGAALTLDGLIRLNPQAAADGYWVRLTQGSDPGAVVADLLAKLGASPPDDEEAFFDETFFDATLDIRDLEQVDRVPQMFAVATAVMALGVVIHVLISALRANRRDLTVMRALGFRRGDIGRAVAWQSIVYALLALAAGIPLGMVAGRTAWRVYAQRLGAVPEPVIPWPSIALVAAVTLTLAATTGFAPQPTDDVDEPRHSTQVRITSFEVVASAPHD
jgi:FtsX-like permease family/MacB-like periplasmic core domain